MIKEPIMPNPEEMERLKKENLAYHSGMNELSEIKSVDEREKNEAKELITDKVQGNFEKQQGKEKNELVNEIKERASNASEKIKQKINDIFIPKLIIFSDREQAEWDLRKIEADFRIFVSKPDDEYLGKVYKQNYRGWTADEIKELYYVLYGEEMEEN